MEHNTLPDTQLNKKTGNLSFFQCPICHKTDRSGRVLIQHCQKEHQSKRLSIGMKYVLRARYHSCHICSMKILCVSKFIERHAVRRHNIRLSEYVTNYIVKSGNRAFPTLLEYKKNNQVFELFKDPIKYEGDNGLIQPHMISSESEDSDEET